MNSNVNTFYQMLSYGYFQQLADFYVEGETPGPLPAGTGDPALVRFAFTLDFTAKLAHLYNNALCRIVDFGIQYLHDRFTQIDMQKNDTSTVSTEGWGLEGGLAYQPTAVLTGMIYLDI